MTLRDILFAPGLTMPVVVLAGVLGLATLMQVLRLFLAAPPRIASAAAATVPAGRGIRRPIQRGPMRR